MSKKILPYSRQSINSIDILKVNEVLKSDYLTTGPNVRLFEKAINTYCNSKFSIAATSATAALHIACMSLNLKKDDIVWTSAISFVASANCALYCEAKVDFIDIDLDTFNLSISHLEKKLKLAKKINKLPKILIPVHLGGQSCDMYKIYKLSKKYRFKIIEDASHAIGGTFNKSKVGSCKYSDITVFSFHPVKIITSGEGGVATTNSKLLAKKMKMYREHGIERDENLFFGKKHGPWHYQQKLLGFNYRMSDIHASLGLNQLKRISKFVKKRNQISNTYKKELKELPIDFQTNKSKNLSTFHLFIILVSKKLHLKFFNYLRENKIFINLHYIPIFLHPYHKKKKINLLEYKQSMDYYKRALSLPVYYDLSQKEQIKIIAIIKKFFKKK